VSGKTRWKYFTGLGATTVAPPTVGQDGVLVPSNDNYVHGMTRGAGGGTWPSAWKPANLGSPAQARSPTVPFAGGSRAFYSTLDGWVHAIDAKTGAILWETQIGTALQTGAGGAPAGIFTAFRGAWDHILVGTRQSAGNKFYFTTTTRVQSAVDNGAGSFLPKWNAQVGLTSPSPVLFWAAQNKLYVGMESWGGPSGAWLYDMSAATGGFTAIPLESGTPTAIGAPSLDTGVTPVMLHAGSVAGVIYAVQVP
jgi:outer membrane protein assembly factor BamB